MKEVEMPRRFFNVGWNVGVVARLAAALVFVAAVAALPAPARAAAGFTDSGAVLTGAAYSAVAWGDYDNDGDLDLLLTGQDSSGGPVTRLYRNDGGGVFTEVSAGLAAVYESSLAWGDYDNDGDLDILLTGFNGTGNLTKLYRNDGGGVFTEVVAGLTGVANGSVAWGDYDNDGDLDILLTGHDGMRAVTKLYRNGGGVFTQTSAGLTAVYHSSVAWGDYDNDGDLDILLSGYDGLTRLTKLYRNEGGGVFTEVSAGLAAVYQSSVAWGDYDNDGDLDVLLMGYSYTGHVTKVYRNDGAGAFTEIAAGLPGIYAGTAVWGDYDNDGDLDVLLTGYGASTSTVTKLFRNDGGDVFTDVAAALTPVRYSSAAWGDYDNDGRLDLIVAGSTASTPPSMTTLYHNEGGAADTAPAAPTGLGGAVVGNRVTLSWTAAADTETPAAGLSYNLRVGTSAGAGDVVVPMAADSGRRRIAALGNAQQGTTATVNGLPPGTYFFSVQAVDTAFVGSAFAEEASFDVTCGYTIDPTSASIGSDGGSSSIDVTAPNGCPWTAQSPDPWITITGGASGDGNGTVSYSVAANTGGPRSGTINVGGQTFAISQGAPCSYSVDPLTITAPVNGGSGTISVTAGPWCGGWTAASNAAWITITSGASGLGNGTVGYKVAANTGTSSRSGTLTIAGATVSLTEPAQPSGPWHNWFAVDTLETPLVGDFNGDGMTDIITFTRQNPLAVGDVYVALSNGTHFVDRNGVPDSSDKWHDWFAISTDETVVIGDFDGDGKDDIATWLGKSTRQVYVALSFGTGMAHEQLWLDGIGFAPSDVILSGDVDGDGRKDLVLFARTQGKVYVARSTGSGFELPKVWHAFFAVSTYERPRVADVDGDGKADIVTFATDSPTAFGDVYVARSDGKQFVDQNGVANNSTKWHDWFSIDPAQQIRIGDLDGDGPEDFFTFLPGFAQCYTVRSLRTRMDENVLWPSAVAPLSTDVPYVGDANGDGKADIIVFSQSAGKVYVSLGR
jgi:hypothetical protein